MIRAASAGVVVTVLCNVTGNTYPPTGGPLPCDSDGNPGLGRCGWYVQIMAVLWHIAIAAQRAVVRPERSARQGCRADALGSTIGGPDVTASLGGMWRS